MDMDLSGHFEDMLEERGIARDWVQRTINLSDETEEHDDDTCHYLKRIPEFGNRWLRVIVNVNRQPKKGVTAFFDRRLRRKRENQSR
jgi:hypothetical protein